MVNRVRVARAAFDVVLPIQARRLESFSKGLGEILAGIGTGPDSSP